MLDTYLEQLQEDEYLEEFVGLTVIALAAIYKKYLSKAAKACKSKPPHEKNRCMLTYQIAGKKAQLQHIKSMTNKCSESKDKDKCLQKVQRWADRTKSSIDKLVEKHGKATIKMNKKLEKMKG